VLFRSESLTYAVGMLARMFWWHGGPLRDTVTVALTHQRLAALVVGALVVLLPARFVTGRFLQFSKRRGGDLARLAYLTAGLGYATILLAAGTFSPFLYYQF
jgi:alginate O-acetyltransferase complex protein AlgI